MITCIRTSLRQRALWLFTLAAGVAVSSSAVAAPPQFVLSWGSNGTADGQFMRPYCLAIGPGDVVYVADVFSPQVQIQKFTSTGSFLTKWGTQGTGQGQIGEFVYSLAVAPNGNVYALDGSSSEVEIYGSAGAYIGTFGTFGSGPGQLDHPEGIAIDAQGFVYIADSENARVQKFTAAGQFVAQWGSLGIGDGQFKKPYGITIDPQGFVYVSDFDPTASRIQKFTSSGAYLVSFGFPGTSGDGALANPFGLAVDQYGHVYVADSFNDQVQVFSTAGSFLLRWGTTGTGQGQFDGPVGVALGSDGALYVADAFNDRVQKFAGGGPVSVPAPGRASGLSLRVLGSPATRGDRVSFQISGVPNEAVMGGIYDLSGRRVTQFHGMTGAAGQLVVGRDRDELDVTSGIYFVRIRQKDQATTARVVFLQ